MMELKHINSNNEIVKARDLEIFFGKFVKIEFKNKFHELFFQRDVMIT